MKNYFLPAIMLTILTAILFGVVYPLTIVGIAAVVAPDKGEGKQIKSGDRVMGFEVIGQSFKSDRYFNSRPSAVNYNAAATGGSNKGPSNPDYLKQVNERISEILLKNPGISKKDIPVDLITASGGGLDPHISLQSAQLQVKRISKVRSLDEATTYQLITDNAERPLFGFIGMSHINVLQLNIALDAMDNRK